MRRALFLLVILAGAGCDTTHLGDGYGRRTRTALDAQAQNRPAEEKSAGALDGEDAKTTMDKQHQPGGTAAGAPGQQGGTTVLMPAPVMPSGGGSGSGSGSGTIKLEGK